MNQIIKKQDSVRIIIFLPLSFSVMAQSLAIVSAILVGANVNDSTASSLCSHTNAHLYRNNYFYFVQAFGLITLVY